MNHYYCDISFWRASDQAEVAQHLKDRARMSGEPDAPRRPGLLRSILLSILRMAGLAGLAEQPVEASPAEREQKPVRESCECGGEEGLEHREPTLDDGEWILRCTECGHLDRLLWLSEEARPLALGLALRRLRLSREVRS